MLARGRDLDAQAMSAATALELATVGAAKAIGLDAVGRLEAGWWADMIRVDLDQPAFTPGIESDLLTSLVFAGSAAFVSDVWVAGRQVVVDGQCTTIDMQDSLEAVRRIGARIA